MTMQWSGDLAANLARIAERIRPAAEAGLRAAADNVLNASNTLAPEDTGDLISSGKVTAEELTATIAYSSKHAIPQHEKTQYRHPRGQAKFLQTAMDDQRGEVLPTVAKHVRSALGG